MFNFLKRKVSLADSGILKGMTDYHSHLLPGVDDGVKTMAETFGDTGGNGEARHP